MDLELIKSITHGAYDIYAENDTVFFKRFTAKQKSAYDIDSGLKARAACASGICFDFETDSSYVKISCDFLKRARNFGYFDLYIDGVFVGSIGKDEAGSNETVIFDIPKIDGGTRRVTIYLPHLLEIGVCGFEVEDGAKVIPIEKENKLLLCLGDSITQGMDAKFPSSAYPVQIACELKMELLNQSVGGYIYKSESLDKDLHIDPDMIIVAYGTNDWTVGKDEASLQKEIDDYFGTLTAIYDSKTINVITPIWRFDINETKAVSFETLTNIIKESALKYGVANIVDGMNLMPHDVKFYAGDTNIHPGDLGFMHYSKNLLKYLKPYTR